MANELFAAIARTYGLYLLVLLVSLSVALVVQRRGQQSRPGRTCRSCPVATGYRRSERTHRLLRVGRRAARRNALAALSTQRRDPPG